MQPRISMRWGVALRDEHGAPAQDDPWQTLQALAERSNYDRVIKKQRWKQRNRYPLELELAATGGAYLKSVVN